MASAVAIIKAVSIGSLTTSSGDCLSPTRDAALWIAQRCNGAVLAKPSYFLPIFRFFPPDLDEALRLGRRLTRKHWAGPPDNAPKENGHAATRGSKAKAR